MSKARVLLLLLACTASAGPVAALPLTVAHVDAVSGLEWAQISETGGLTWDDIATVCSSDGSTSCSGNVGSVELAGWTWATSEQVLRLFINATDLTELDLDDQDESSANSTWAPQFLALFNPTFVSGRDRTVAGLVSDGPLFDPQGAWTPYVTDTAGGDDAASKRRVIAKYTASQGVWLQRTASVPEPTTTALITLGVVGWSARRFMKKPGRDRSNL